MNQKTTFNEYKTSLWKLSETIIVECPKCNSRARIKDSKVSCLSCGFNKKTENSKNWYGPLYGCTGRNCARCGQFINKFFNEDKEIEHFNLKCHGCGNITKEKITWHPQRHVGHDPYFGIKLYLHTEYKNHILWAYNHEHLSFMKNYIESSIRAREPNSNGSMASRFPKWMKEKKNRDSILKEIQKLELKQD